MLHIHFTDADLARTRVAIGPNPMWEIAFSLHRFQTRQGRWAYADWHRDARRCLSETGLDRVVASLLLPLYPRASYFPDFLTPAEGEHGLDAGLEAIAAVPARQVLREVGRLARVCAAPAWMSDLPGARPRADLAQALRDYYAAVIAPVGEQMRASVDADRLARCRAVLHGGTEGLLDSFAPVMRWRPPVLHVDYPADERDLHLGGRGLLLLPSYFCWHTPVALADPALPQILVYPLRREPPACAPDNDRSAGPLNTLLGTTRAAVLRGTAAGATTGELARIIGVSAPVISHHTAALRDAGLITSRRYSTTVLHTLTPPGAAVLRASGPASVRHP